ncbi:MAG: flagellar biosynthetic protein FliO [Desulfobacterium sp.]
MDNILDASLISMGIKTAAILAMVLACLIFVLYLIRRFLHLGTQKQDGLDIKRLGAFYLSSKERIEVVEISGERIVLGVAPGSVNYLTRLKDPNENSPG